MFQVEFVACVAGENGEGEGEQGHGRKMGDWGLGTRERLLQRPLFFHFCGRQWPQNSDWLIFDSKSHENNVIWRGRAVRRFQLGSEIILKLERETAV